MDKKELYEKIYSKIYAKRGTVTSTCSRNLLDFIDVLDDALLDDIAKKNKAKECELAKRENELNFREKELEQKNEELEKAKTTINFDAIGLNEERTEMLKIVDAYADIVRRRELSSEDKKFIYNMMKMTFFGAKAAVHNDGEVV